MKESGAITLALLACCVRTQRIGIAACSQSIAVGRLTFGALRSKVGGSLTLGSADPVNNTLAVKLLEQGHAPDYVANALRANDRDAEARAIAVVDRHGRVAGHCGKEIRGSGRHRMGSGYAALLTGAAATPALDALCDGFEREHACELDERLLEALEGVESACDLRSVAILVFGREPYSDVDLRVDLHEKPVAALRHLYDEYQPFAAYYLERGKHPRQAIPQKEFADMLYARTAGRPS